MSGVEDINEDRLTGTNSRGSSQLSAFADGDHVSANIVSTKVGPCFLLRTLNFFVQNYSCICPEGTT